ncbi:MAG: iron ABC transporter permease [Bacteroidota bacterium]
MPPKTDRIPSLNGWSVLLLVLVGLLVLPLLAIGWRLTGGVGESWSHVREFYLPTYLSNSAILLLGAGTLSTLLGLGCAWCVTQLSFRGRRLLEILLFLPLSIPSYLMAYAYVGLLGYGGSLTKISRWFGWEAPQIELMNHWGLIWVLGLSLFPYVYASCRAFLLRKGQRLRQAAQLLGATGRTYFLRVALPLTAPAIIGGLLLVGMEILNDYGAAKYFGINTFTTGIFRTWTALEDLPSATYLAAILVALVLVLSLLARWLRGRRSYARTEGEGKVTRQTLRGGWKVAVPALLWLVVTVALILPTGQFLYWGLLTLDRADPTKLALLSAQSIFLAGAAALVTALVSVAIVFLNRWSKLRGLRSVSRLATVGYALPGAIIGIGIIGSSQAVINGVEAWFGLRIGYLFYASSVVLLYAYVFRFLAVAYYPLEASSIRTGKQMGEAAALLGASRLKSLWRVELPLLRPAFISALLLVFIDTLKELPLTLILKPYDVETLATNAYAYADDEQVTLAAWPALLLIAAAAVLTVVVLRREQRQEASITK